MKKNKPLFVGITVLVVMVVLLGLGFAAQRQLNKPTHTVALEFPTASGLVPGSDVFEAGAKVGTISSIDPIYDNSAGQKGGSGLDSGLSQPGTAAVVTVQISDDHWPLHQGVSAGIRPKSLLGEKYVDIHDGPAKSAAYDSGKTLKASADAVPVELDAFINSLDPDTRAAAKVLINDLGAGLAGRGPDLNQAIAAGREDLQHLATFGSTLNNRDPDLDRIIVGLDGVLGKLTQNEQLVQMQQLISNGQATLNAIEQERLTFSRAFVDSQTALADLNAAFDQAIPNLKDTFDLAPALLSHLQQEADMLAFQGGFLTANNKALLTALQQGISHGPTASGGGLELVKTGPNAGKALPIFRVCVATPQQPNNSCQGNDFTPQPLTQPEPSSSQSATGTGSGGSLSVLAGMIGA